jgi:hypothetical protein
LTQSEFCDEFVSVIARTSEVPSSATAMKG